MFTFHHIISPGVQNSVLTFNYSHLPQLLYSNYIVLLCWHVGVLSIFNINLLLRNTCNLVLLKWIKTSASCTHSPSSEKIATHCGVLHGFTVLPGTDGCAPAGAGGVPLPWTVTQHAVTWTAAMSSFLCSCSWVWRSPALLPLWDDQCIYIFVTYLVIYSSSCHFKSVWVSVFCWTIFWRMLVTKDLMVPIDFHSIFPPYCKRPWLPSNVCLQNIFFCAQQKLIEVWNNSRMSKLFHLFKVSYGKENYFFSFYQNVLTSPQKTSNVSNNIHI